MNRTVPKITAPKAGLGFSASPTAEEIFQAHIFAEPLVPVGGAPTAEENSALANALLAYAKRSGPDDFSTLTGYLNRYPQSPWTAALQTDLGLEYYNTAHYSLAIDAWKAAWALANSATNRTAHALVDRALGELLNMDARLGRMEEIEALLKSIGNRPLLGPAAERAVLAREALWNMQNHPEISFRCGPLALRSIRLALNLDGASDVEILNSASTTNGCSLPQVAELSRKIGLNFQMAFRETQGDFITPSVVHWKVGHYAALVRKVGDLYELQDPTFGNRSWATKAALKAETTGYFLVASGPLPTGWRAVDKNEGANIWGKGMTGGNDPQHIAKNDLARGAFCGATGTGMAVPKVHLMDVNLNLTDEPVGYAPPVGPPVFFTLRYNQRDLFQPGNFNYGNLGPQWTSDWFTYLTDNPTNVLADVNLYVGGGGQRTYTGFNPTTQSFNYQQYDQNLLTRTGPSSYVLLAGDGSKMIFSLPDSSIGTTRNVYITQKIDPQGNTLNFTYDSNYCLVSITDAIGQVTTLTYGLTNEIIGSGPDATYVPADNYKLTKVTDPFGRSATFNYTPGVVEKYYTYFNGQVSSVNFSYAWRLDSVTDVIGITSQFGYTEYDNPVNQFQDFVTSVVHSLTTPYGTSTFFGGDTGNTRSMQITYPDGSKEKVIYNQTNTLQSLTDPLNSVPGGMLTQNSFLQFRNSYYWDRVACALGDGDYSKARIFHFQHTENLGSTAGALESMKNPLENRVWLDYPGQSQSIIVGPVTLPAHIGRVLDDGTSQVFAFGYNPFGHLTNVVDPANRTYSLFYATNGIDELEVRQTRIGNSESLVKTTYNSQHQPLTVTDIAGQVTSYTYNARGQVLTATNAKNETTAYTYDANGYLLGINCALPGASDTIKATYDAFGRVRTLTDFSGYVLTYDYDNLDRVTRITYPDATFCQYTYDRLDCVGVQDRAGRLTSYAFDSMRQLSQQTDPLGRKTYYEWCRCGTPKSLIDPLGRVTSWVVDIQGRRISKQFPDGSQLQYQYEQTTSRLRQIKDEKQQTTSWTYNLDNTVNTVGYGNATVSTPDVSFTYDPNYQRAVSMTDGIGITRYGYIPITSAPALGAGRLLSTSGPLANETLTFGYDELGRSVSRTVDGVAAVRTFDALGRITGESNLLGSLTFGYAGNSRRLLSKFFPNGQTTTMTYGPALQDFNLQQITNAVGATPLSGFTYGNDILKHRINTWSQQTGTQAPSIFSFIYDAANQLLTATVTNSGVQANAFAYTYDRAGNRLTEQASGTTKTATYNSLNQINTVANAAANSRTNEWDARNRLTAVNAGSLRTEFAYDGMSRMASIRQLQNGSQISLRRFTWYGNRMSEERDSTGTIITKRFFGQGVKLQAGTTPGVYYYTRDHLGSVREMTDASGTVRARYSYDPYGRKTKVSGDVDADMGFAGMFWTPEASLFLTHYRAYDPEIGRWLSRDPLKSAELVQGPNLYAYGANNPVNNIDPLGLAVQWVPVSVPWSETPIMRPVYNFYNRNTTPGPNGSPTMTPPEGDLTIRGNGDIMTRGDGDLELRGDGDLALRGDGELALRSEGEMMLREEGELALRTEADVVLETESQVVEEAGGQVMEIADTILERPLPTFPSAPLAPFIGAGLTILMMTDCDTANGIFGLVRQGKGGVLNYYEDRQLKLLESMK